MIYVTTGFISSIRLPDSDIYQESFYLVPVPCKDKALVSEDIPPINKQIVLGFAKKKRIINVSMGLTEDIWVLEDNIRIIYDEESYGFIGE